MDKNVWLVRFRLLQFVFLAIFALGISSMSGEYTAYMKLPFSVFSLDCTIFGVIGVAISEIFSKLSAKWGQNEPWQMKEN